MLVGGSVLKRITPGCRILQYSEDKGRIKDFMKTRKVKAFHLCICFVVEFEFEHEF